MSNLNTIGVDLAKNIIRVSLVSVLGKALGNTALTRTKFAEFLCMDEQEYDLTIPANRRDLINVHR